MMAKSKEQKQQEALERKQVAFFETVLLPFTKRMPGGDYFDTTPYHLRELVKLMDNVQRLALEAKVSFEGTRNAYDSSLEWPAHQLLQFLLARQNWLNSCLKMQANFNKYIGTGELPFSLNMNRFDSDLEILRKKFSEKDERQGKLF